MDINKLKVEFTKLGLKNDWADYRTKCRAQVLVCDSGKPNGGAHGIIEVDLLNGEITRESRIDIDNLAQKLTTKTSWAYMFSSFCAGIQVIYSMCGVKFVPGTLLRIKGAQFASRYYRQVVYFDVYISNLGSTNQDPSIKPLNQMLFEALEIIDKQIHMCGIERVNCAYMGGPWYSYLRAQQGLEDLRNQILCDTLQHDGVKWSELQG